MSERRSELKAVAGADDVAAAKTGERDVTAMTAQLMDGWTQVNNRLMSLAQAPWRHTQAVAEEMRQCQSPKDMIDAQMRLTRVAVDDYMDEAKKLGDLVVKMSGEAMGLLRLPR